MRRSLRKLAATAAACTLALTLAVGAVPNAAKAGVQCSDAGKKAGKAEINLDTPEYHAYFGFQQTGSWTFRDAWYNPSSGLDGTGFSGDNTYNDFITDGGNEKVEGATVTDAVIKGNGTYRVAVEGIGGILPDDDGVETITKLIYVSTDMPYSAKDTVKFSDIKLLIDGNEVTIPEEPFYNLDAQEWGIYQFDIVNVYQTEGYASPSVLTPKDSVEIQFTVSGFNVDDPDAVIAEPTEEPTEAPASSEANTTDSDSEDEGSNSTTVVVIVIVAVVVIGGVILVLRKKK